MKDNNYIKDCAVKIVDKHYKAISKHSEIIPFDTKEIYAKEALLCSIITINSMIDFAIDNDIDYKTLQLIRSEILLLNEQAQK